MNGINILVVPSLDAGVSLCEAFGLDRAVWKIVPYQAKLPIGKPDRVVMVIPDWKKPVEDMAALRQWYDESLPQLYARAHTSRFLHLTSLPLDLFKT